MIVDQMGIYGSVLHYSLVIAFVGGAFILFCYFWHKGRLDMDEEPKIQMLLDEENRNGK